MAIDSMPKRQKPLPRTRREKYDGSNRFADIPNRENRAQQIKRSDDTFKNISIELQDIDEAILFYFKNVIQPKVIENDLVIDVPIIYGNSEFWSSVQQQGFIRDQKGQIIAPIIMFRKNNISKDQDMPMNHIDRNLVHTFPQKWSAKNRYDRFSRLNNLKPAYEIYNVVVPDYVIITYECVIWTSFVSQMNKIIEPIQFSEGLYWGDQKRFKFKASIDSFDQTVEVDTSRGRLVRSNFTLSIRGFLIPEYFNDLVNTQKGFSRQQIIIDNETDIDILSLTSQDPTIKRITVTGTTQPVGGANISIMNYIDQQIATLEVVITYLRKMYSYSSLTLSSATIVNDVVTFPAVYTASAPVGYTATSKNDFLIFVNSQYMEYDAFAIQQNGANFIVTVDTGSLGYSLDSTDK